MSKALVSWLATYFDKLEPEAEQLTQRKFAMDFLITRSIYESDCFDGFCQFGKIKSFSQKLDGNPKCHPEPMDKHVKYFHERYQNKDNLRKLLHGKNGDNFKTLINKNIGNLTNPDKFFL